MKRHHPSRLLASMDGAFLRLNAEAFRAFFRPLASDCRLCRGVWAAQSFGIP
jgi:hypothetical protein